MTAKSERDKERDNALIALMDSGGYIKESSVEMDAADLPVDDACAARAGSGRVVITATGRLAAGAPRAKSASTL